MKKFMFFAVAALLCAGMVASANAQPMARVGGGLIFSGTVWGGAAAVDIPLSSDMPIALSPFFEFYKKNGVSSIPFGVNVLYKVKPMGDKAGAVYVGAGGGALKVNKGGGTTYLIDAVGGATYPVSEKMSLYGELKYLYASKKTAGIKTIDLNDAAAAVGIAFNVGQ